MTPYQELKNHFSNFCTTNPEKSLNLFPNPMKNPSLKSLHLIIFLSLSTKLLFTLAQDHENQFIYNGFHRANLNLNGDSNIHSNDLLQLTNTSKQRLGRAFYPNPVSFNKLPSGSGQSLSFSTNFVFAMVPEFPTLGGHGMAFFISPSMDFSQATGSQYLGLFNSSNNGLSSNHVLAIEFDARLNPEFGDINDNRAGLDLNSLNSTVSANVTYFSNKEGINKSLSLTNGNPIQVWIDFNEVEKVLNVTLAPIKVPKPNRPLLSKSIDLSPIFLETMYVGFSATTGGPGAASSHYILGWSFSRKGQAQALDISKLPSLPKQRKSRWKMEMQITVSVITVSVVVISISGAVYIVRKRKYEEIYEEWERQYGPQRFSYRDLYKATKGFKSENFLGSGGFGEVYRGVLSSSKREVAVKKVSHDSRQGMKEFVAEITSMGRLRHRNLVQLLGYCRRRGELLLVYDYMPNGCLDKFLFSNEKPNLRWAQRYRILRGVASGLLYLHEEWEQVVLHRDVKASNVLLDANLNGRLGDFGLARLYDHGANPETTQVVGTVGYLAPELTRTGKATTCSDVFGFGAFMLEVACGRRPIQVQGLSEEMILVEKVYESWKKGNVLEMGDPKLEGEYAVEEMELVLKLGLVCSHFNPSARPSMRQVMQFLDGDAILPEIVLDAASFHILSTSNEGSSQFAMSFFSSAGSESVLSTGR